MLLWRTLVTELSVCSIVRGSISYQHILSSPGTCWNSVHNIRTVYSGKQNICVSSASNTFYGPVKGERTMASATDDSIGNENLGVDKTSLKMDDEFSHWKFSPNDYLSFPLDPIRDNYIRHVPKAVFSITSPTPLKGTKTLAAYSSAALKLIDLTSSVAKSQSFLDLVSGSQNHSSSSPLTHCYGGHQFGWWVPQLGDGRAHLLGLYVNSEGSRWELQLKGSGLTPYSRAGDGRAVIRSSVREFLAAEALDALGFRTSRCGTLVISEESVIRDQFYNGNIRYEKTAVVLRLAPSWFRFGSLEVHAKNNNIEILRQIVEYVIEHHFTHIQLSDPDHILTFYATVIEETAKMIAEWQSVGFTHGVMNTDNMSLLSLTIDYGPYGFVEEFSPHYVPNSSDEEGMYSYIHQPEVGRENLRKLGMALAPLLTHEQKSQLSIILAQYDIHFQTAFRGSFGKKLGFMVTPDKIQHLIEQLFQAMDVTRADFTMTFWELGNVALDKILHNDFPKDFWALPKLAEKADFTSFVQIYNEILTSADISDETRRETMATVNPRYILRNWIAQEAIKLAEKGDYSGIQRALDVLRHPWTRNADAENAGFAAHPPSWSRSLRVSCSS